MPQRHRYATRAELIKLLAEDTDEAAVLDVVLQRLTNHGVDVDTLVKITVEVGENLDEKPGLDA